jgi:tight adherence protein C
MYIIPVIIFGAVLLLVIGIFQYVTYLKNRRGLLKKIETEGEIKAEPGDRSLGARVQNAYLNLTQSLSTLAKPKGEEDISQMRAKFLQAGLSRFRNVLVVFYGSKVFLAILFPVLFIIFKVSLLRPMLLMQLIPVILVLAVVGFYLPDLWLRIRIASRRDQIFRGFPDALDLMVICAEAGMGLDAAINRVGKEMELRNAAVSEEMKLLSLELRAGKPRREALKNLALRTDVEDVQSFSTLLIQTDKFGTSIANAMRVQADSMRVKRTQKVEEIAAKMAVKLIFPTVLFIFPSMFVVLMGPALIRAFRVWRGF